MNKAFPRAFRLILFTFLVNQALGLNAQILHPQAGFVFDDTDLPRIDLAISQSNLDALYANPGSNDEYYAVFTFTRAERVEGPLDVGLRFRGDSIRFYEKKSFRISFNSFDANENFYGIEKMNLNAEAGDPSLIRSKAVYELYRRMGVAAPRSNHVLLYINEEFYGVYLHAEHIDERFAKSRFDNNDGNLYRCQDRADLSYIGTGEDDYKYEINDRRSYALRTNEKWDDYQDLSDLISTLDTYSGADLPARLELQMNLGQLLKVFAVEVMAGHWDAYSANSNNYYLYRDQLSGRFELIPWSPEYSLGADLLGIDWSERSIYTWQNGPHPLREKILDVEECKLQYSAFIRELAGYVQSSAFLSELDRWRQLIAPHVAADPYFSLDRGFSYSDFENAMNTGWGNDIDLGVLDFLNTRASSALAEAMSGNAPPLFSYLAVHPGDESLVAAWTLEEDAPDLTTSLHYRIDEGGWISLPQEEADSIDPISGAEIFSDTLSGIPGQARVELYFSARDAGGLEHRFPEDSSWVFSYPLLNGPLYINEFLASNQDIKRDEFGEYDDWLEIFNASDEEVWLADYALSDNFGNPGKYRFPEQYLEAGGFFLVWLDDDEDQGQKHASFKISKDGEELRLSERPSRGFRIVDSLRFGLQERDVSYGRETDGGPDWVFFNSPTPEYSNLLTSAEQAGKTPDILRAWPNPAHDIVYFTKRVSGGLYNLSGQILLQIRDSDHLDLSALPPGLYLIRTRQGEVLRMAIASD